MYTIYGVLLHLTLFFAFVVVAIYIISPPQNMLCSDLRAFVWRKIEPKIELRENNDKYEVGLPEAQRTQDIESVS